MIMLLLNISTFYCFLPPYKSIKCISLLFNALLGSQIFFIPPLIHAHMHVWSGLGDAQVYKMISNTDVGRLYKMPEKLCYTFIK